MDALPSSIRTTWFLATLIAVSCTPPGGDLPGGPDNDNTDTDTDTDTASTDSGVPLSPHALITAPATDAADPPQPGALNEAGPVWGDCGNGVIEPPELCDDGPDNDDNANTYGSCNESCTFSHGGCGDTIVEENIEECDDGPAGSLACTPDFKFMGRIVFVSSLSFTGAEIGGIAGADYRCQQAALAANIENVESFRAWLSAGDDEPADWLAPDPDNRRFVLVDGTTIALTVDDLTDGSLAAPIDITEHNEKVEGSHVWTNTAMDGSTETSHDCEQWTSNEGNGRIGANDKINSAWTSKEFKFCSMSLHLYCIEQPPNGG